MGKEIDKLRMRALAAKMPAVIFRRILAEPDALLGTSYFGGLPRLPDPAAWPSRSTGEPLSFLGQIDLGTLAALPLETDFPRQGSLLFFADSDVSRHENARLEGEVLFIQSSTLGLPKTPRPPGLMRLYGSMSDDTFRWMADAADTDDLATVFPAWAVETSIVDTFLQEDPIAFYAAWDASMDHDDGEDPPDFEGIISELQNDAFTSVLSMTPDRIMASSFAQPYGDRRRNLPFAAAIRGQIWMPDDAWPYMWINIRIAAASILKECPYTVRSGTGPIAAAMKDWMRLALLDRAFESVPAPEAAAFRAWVLKLREDQTAQLKDHQINLAIADSVVEGADAVFGHARKVALRLPHGLANIVASRTTPCFGPRHRALVLRHQFLGHAQNIQGAAWRMEGNYRLLMQFDTDEAMFWMWGDAGCLQFWIKPEDLSAGLFERCVLTAESY